MADLTDVVDPAVHLLLRFGHEVKNPRRCFDHEQVLPIKVPLDSELAVEHLHLALLQVDGADGLLGAFALIVLQHVGVSAHSTSAQHKPAFSPSKSLEFLLGGRFDEPAGADHVAGTHFDCRESERERREKSGVLPQCRTQGVDAPAGVTAAAVAE